MSLYIDNIPICAPIFGSQTSFKDSAIICHTMMAVFAVALAAPFEVHAALVPSAGLDSGDSI
jgi:hypothetical protein